ncbi:Kinesin light chain 3, partial [Chytriomyces hyalinus]
SQTYMQKITHTTTTTVTRRTVDQSGTVRTETRKTNSVTVSVSATPQAGNEVQSVSSNEPVRAEEDAEGDMSDPRTFSIKGLPLAHIHSLIETWGGPSALEGLTTTDVCVRFLKPLTIESGLSLCAQYYTSKNTALASLVQNATWFISHAWQYRFLDVIGAVDNFAAQEGLDPDTTVIWFDLFSNSQHDTASKPFTWWETTFMNAVKKIGNVVMVIQPWSNPIPLTRVWCIFELYASTATGSSFHVAMTNAETKAFMAQLLDNAESYYEVLSSLRSQNAKSFLETDRLAIFALVRETVGFIALDRLVLDTLLEWTFSQLKQFSEKAETREEALSWKVVLGTFYYLMGRNSDAEKLLLELVGQCQEVFGDAHIQTLNVLYKLGVNYLAQARYKEAEQQFLQCIELSEGGDQEASINFSVSLATAYSRLGRFVEAEAVYKDCIEKGKMQQNAPVLATLGSFGGFYLDQKRYAEAEPMLKQVLEERVQALGKTHPISIRSMKALGRLYLEMEKFDDAEVLLLAAVEGNQQAFGDGHFATLGAMNDVAVLHDEQRLFSKAEQIYLKCVELRTATVGEFHPDTLLAKCNLAMNLQFQYRNAEAEPLFDASVEGFKKVLGLLHPDTLRTMTNAAVFYELDEQFEKASVLYKEVLEARTKMLGLSHASTLVSMSSLADVYNAEGRKQEAKELYENCLEQRVATLGPHHLDTLATTRTLAKLNQSLGDPTAAETLFLNHVNGLKIALGTSDRKTMDAMNELGLFYISKQQFSKAEPMFETALQESKQTLGSNHLYTLSLMNNLAFVYKAQGKADEAKDTFNKCLETCNVLGESAAAIKLRALFHLGSLHESLGEIEDAAKLLSACHEGQVEMLGPDHPQTLATQTILDRLHPIEC